MNARRYRVGPGNRLAKGAAILAAAQVVDTAPVKPRLSRFLTAHRSYVGAQGKVDAAESDLRAAQAKVTRREIEVDRAVETLALALANEGHSRTKPFAAFGAGAPSFVKALGVRNKVDAVHQLVDRVQQAKTVSQKSRDSAHAADQVARTVEAALLPLEQLEASLREVRCQRDTIGQKWDIALAALRRDARSAADDGAPGLYPALFGAARSRKRAKPGPGPEPVPTPAPTPADTPAVTT